MKTVLFLTTILVLLSHDPIRADEKKPIELPEAKLEISCNYVDDEQMAVRATAYGKPSEDALMFAAVNIYKYAKNGVEKRKVAQYRMDFVDEGLSLSIKFEDRKLGYTFEAFGDDMGGMSKLYVNDQEYTLTCNIDPV